MNDKILQAFAEVANRVAEQTGVAVHKVEFFWVDERMSFGRGFLSLTNVRMDCERSQTTLDDGVAR